MDPTQLRTLFLRLRNAPPEIIEQALIDVPLPQLLEVCSLITGFSQYCNDRNFWLSRAHARYGETNNQFDQASIHPSQGHGGQYEPLSGFSAYLRIVLDHASSEDNPEHPSKPEIEANHELKEIESEIIKQLKQQARAKSKDPVKYYRLMDENWLRRNPRIDLDIIIPASSLEEALVQLNDYVQPYGEDVFRRWTIDLLSGMILNYDETPTLQDFIDKITSTILQGLYDDPIFELHTILPRPDWIQ